MSDTSNLSRRRFLKATGVMAGAAALGGTVLSAVAAEAADPQAHAAPAAPGAANTAFRGRMFFTNDLEFSTLSQAAERIFPKDETGPGAIELFVPYFIDNQLAAGWGYNAREYTGGPHDKGAPTQGYQTPLNRQDLFTQGLAALNEQSNKTFKKNFPDLADADKDAVLKMCAAGDIPTEGFTSSEFFALLRSAVLAGAYADPMYNGNGEMQGWKMKDYPGAQMEYMSVIDSDKFEKIDPVSLASMQ